MTILLQRKEILISFFKLFAVVVFGTSLFANGPKFAFQRFGISEGLSSDIALAILPDRDGFVWIGTQSGLNRFDGYQFKQYRYDPKTPGSISADETQALFQDSKGRLWVGTQSGGLNLYHPETDTFSAYRHDPDDPHSLSFNAVQKIYEDSEGKLWVPTWGGGLNHFDPETGKAYAYRHDASDPSSIGADIIWDMGPGLGGTWWLATNNGLSHFDPKTRKFTNYYHEPGNPNSLMGNKISSVHQQANGIVWIGFHSEGLDRYDPSTGKITHYPYVPNQQNGLADGSINYIHEDAGGILWMGCDSGLTRYDPKKNKFRHFLGNPNDPHAISTGRVWRIAEDAQRNLWMSTTAGISVTRPANTVFGSYQRKDGDEYLTTETYFSFANKDNRYLWAGTSLGLLRFDRWQENFEHWAPSPNPNDVSNRLNELKFTSDGRLLMISFKSLLEFDPEQETFKTFFQWSHPLTSWAIDPDDGTYWIGTGEGLLFYDPKTGIKKLFQHNDKDPDSLAHNVVLALFFDSQKRLWVGTYGAGLDCFDPNTGAFIHHQADPDDPTAIANNAINQVVEGPDGTIWVATRSGLSRRDPDTGHFRSYWVKDGLPHPFINDILFDDSGYMWVSTDGGVVKLDTETDHFTYFDKTDGLLDNIFSGGASTRFADGTLVFGGDGFNIFNPSVMPRRAMGPVVLTDLQLFNESVPLSTPQQETPLKELLHRANHVELSYKEYVFAFRFAVLDYSFSDKHVFEYMMEGLDKDWIPARKGSRLAGYTNLDGGDYTLHVRARDKNGNYFKPAALNITIKPPPWKTPLAYVLYVAVILGIIIGYVRAQQRKLEKEREIVHRLNEVDRLKDAFLANTSHELRTPLHGMIGLAEAVLDHHGQELDDVANQNLEMIVASGQRLSNLINDILDFSKLEHNSLQCKIQPVDLLGTVRVVLGLTAPLLGTKELTLENNICKKLPAVLADENRLQQVLFNLVGNAVKFTEEGKVSITATKVEDMIQVSVTDTGIGIPQDKVDDIFKAFLQADGSTAREYGGTGLGLAVTRKLVELQNGKIWVESKIGEGSTFSFSIPIAPEGSVGHSPEVLMKKRDQHRNPQGLDGQMDVPEGGLDQRRFRILVVDDDPVNRMVLINHLSHAYQVVAVESGIAAIAAVEEHQGFDLILLDVMMPKMTGFDVCRHLRNTFTSHELPVIYLTAKMHETDVVTGFETGANDYIIKPVSKGELLMRVETHLQLLDTNRNLEAKVEDRTRHLVSAQKELLREAHTAGMAEIAVDVMHNVGNRLNSLGTSVQLLEELTTKDRKGLSLLERFTELVAENQDNLTEFLTTDATVARLPEFLPKITRKMVDNRTAMIEESRKLTAHIQAMAATLKAQQKHSGLTGVMSNESINELMGSVLQMGSLSVQEVKGTLQTDFSEGLPRFTVNRVRLIRVLICLFQNAIEAIATRSDGGIIQLSTALVDNQIRVEIQDNGDGISNENLVRIFAYGFTTRPGKQGFGLHYCANTLREMGADIKVTSDGPGSGTQAVLSLPLNMTPKSL